VRPQDSILFDQTGQGLLLPMIQPADERSEQSRSFHSAFKASIAME